MNYNIKKVLVRNPHSEVMLGECYNDDQSHAVIIKTVLPPIVGKVLDRLIIIKALDHYRIPRLVDYGECSDRGIKKYYTTSLHVPGITLTHLLQRLSFFKIKPPISLVFHILSSICDILEFTHQFDAGKSGFLPHGNICPDHILISFDGTVYLTDTGIADLVTYRYNGIGLIKNELTIFSHPDIHNGKECKRCHELYSLGMVFLCMLTGYDDFVLSLDQINLRKCSSLSSFFPSIEPEICKIIGSLTGENTAVFSSIEELNACVNDFRKINEIQSQKCYSMLVIYALFRDVFNIEQNIENEVYNLIRNEKNLGDSLLMLLRETGVFDKAQGDYSEKIIQDYKVETESIQVVGVAQPLQDNSDCLESQSSEHILSKSTDEKNCIEQVYTHVAGVMDAVFIEDPVSHNSNFQKTNVSAFEAFSGIRVDTSAFYRKVGEHPFANLMLKK